MITLELDVSTKKALSKALMENEKQTVSACENALKDFLRVLEKSVSEKVADESTNTGLLLQSIYQKQEGLEGEIGSTAAHAPYVEFGTRPHRPPFEPIREWVWLKRHDLGIPDEAVYPYAKAVIEAIARRGTKERKHFTHTLEENEELFNQMITRAIERFVK